MASNDSNKEKSFEIKTLEHALVVIMQRILAPETMKLT